MQNEIVFIDGFSVFPPHEKAPEFVVAGGFMKAKQLSDFLAKHQNDRGEIKFQILKSRKGGFYAKLDTYEPNPNFQKNTPNREVDSISMSDIPL